MFEIEEGKVKLSNMNTRVELHGEESRSAVDLDFKWETGNGCLALFAPALRSCLYQAAEPDLMDKADPNVENARALRFSPLGVIRWGAGDLVGGQLIFHTGVDPKKSNVVFAEVGVGKYKLEPKEGGTVVVYFQVQVHPTEAQMGKLMKFLTDKECTISVTPPDAPADLKGD